MQGLAAWLALLFYGRGVCNSPEHGQKIITHVNRRVKHFLEKTLKKYLVSLN